MRRRATTVAVLAALLAVVLVPAAVPAKDAPRKVDLIKVVPDFDSLNVRSIALLPVVTYDKNLQTERIVGTSLGQNFRATGQRWISSNTTRDMLTSALGDSTVRAVREEILKNVRVDSLRAPRLCATLRVNAVLAVRVDQWDQLQMLWNQPGKPSTTVQIKAALVDSTGRQLWSASGSETGEGAYHDPSTNPISIATSGLENTPMTGQGGPPAFEEVVNRMFQRWAERFPHAGAAPPPAK